MDSETGNLIINEYLSSPSDGNDEFIEFYNDSENGVDLSKWAYCVKSNPEATDLKVISSIGLVLPPKKSLALTTCVNWLAHFNPDGLYLEIDLPTINEGKTIELVNIDSNQKKQIIVEGAEAGFSMERISGTDSWSKCPIGSTPGMGNSNFISTDTSFTCTPTTIPTIDGRRWISCFAGSNHFMSEVEIRVFNSNGQIVLT